MTGTPPSAGPEIRRFHPDVRAEELAALPGVVDTAQLGRGPQSVLVARGYAAHLGVAPDQVLTANSATDRFSCIAEAQRLVDGDVMIAPSISFVDAVQAAAESGARVVVCDSCPRSINVRVEDLERVRTPRSRALMLLHFGGVACDIDAIVP